jgi:hypothetical protein
VDKSKVALVIDVHQIMVVLVNLNRSELTLVHNVPVAERAQVEPIGKAKDVRSALSQDVKLELESLCVKLLRISDLGLATFAVGRFQHYERLQNSRLPRQSCRAKDSGIARNFTPS